MGPLSQARSLNYGETEVGVLQVQGQPGHFSETLSQKVKQAEGIAQQYSLCLLCRKP